jgi:hypothetical protein
MLIVVVVVMTVTVVVAAAVAMTVAVVVVVPDGRDDRRWGPWGMGGWSTRHRQELPTERRNVKEGRTEGT